MQSIENKFIIWKYKRNWKFIVEYEENIEIIKTILLVSIKRKKR
jgi:hypothetical protein